MKQALRLSWRAITGRRKSEQSVPERVLLGGIAVLAVEAACFTVFPGAEVALSIVMAAQLLLAAHVARECSRFCERLRKALEEATSGSACEQAIAESRRLGVLGESFVDLFKVLERARQELVDNHLESVKAIALAVEARDAYTQGHCLRVRFLARRILERLDVDEGYRRSAETAALLHDVGKIGVPDTLLLKKDRLTEEEYSRLMLHVEIGVEILRPLTTLSQTALFVRHHHERYDGTGYPDRLAGAQIPLASRVIAVADAIDAMRSTRPHRKALGVEETISELRRVRGKQLDPEIVDIAIAILDPRGELSKKPVDIEAPSLIEAGELARA